MRNKEKGAHKSAFFFKTPTLIPPLIHSVKKNHYLILKYMYELCIIIMVK